MVNTFSRNIINEDLGAEGRLTTLKDNFFVKGFIERNSSNPESIIYSIIRH